MSKDLLAFKPAAKLRSDHVTSPITTTAWVEISSALPVASTAMEIFDSSGSVLVLATGDSGSEVELPYYVTPGGSGILLPIELPHGVRLSAKAVDLDATTGNLIINLFQ